MRESEAFEHGDIDILSRQGATSRHTHYAAANHEHAELCH
jgi:hypothetical protein